MLNRFQLVKFCSILVPIGVFLATFTIHYIWHGFFPEQDQIQSQWVLVPDETPWFQRYIDSKNYWFGYTYSICFAFIAISLMHYLNYKCSSSRNLAFGGMTLTGIFALAGCFLIGCCGSPMIVVWLNIFGAKFAPLAKPIIAMITTVSIAGAWFWMVKKTKHHICQCDPKINMRKT